MEESGDGYVVPVPLALPIFAMLVGGMLFSLRATCARGDAITSLIYVGTSVTLDLSIAYTGGNGKKPEYEKLVVIMCVEMVKLSVSAFLLWKDPSEKVRPTASDAAAVSLPAGLYALNNWLVLMTLQSVNVAVFAVLRETNLVFTALIWCLAFHAELGHRRWAAILGILFASTATQVENFFRTADFSALYVLLLTFVNALATVSNEVFLKSKEHLDINTQNILLYTLCSGAAALTLLVQRGPSAFIPSNMFHGFGVEVWVIMGGQCFLGLVVSRLLRNTSSVAKGVLTVFRPLGLLAASPLVTGTGGYEISRLVAGLACGAAAYAYFKEGKLETPKYGEGSKSPKPQRRGRALILPLFAITFLVGVYYLTAESALFSPSNVKLPPTL
jgi:hypothetical protein